jgi:hypothetical protein
VEELNKNQQGQQTTKQTKKRGSEIFYFKRKKGNHRIPKKNFVCLVVKRKRRS